MPRESRRKAIARFMNSWYTEMYNSMVIPEKENYNEDNKQHEWKREQYFPELTLKISRLKMFQFIWNSAITLNKD